MAGSSSSKAAALAAALLLALALGGCGKVKSQPGDGGIEPPPPTDGGPTATPGAPGHDLIGGSGRVSGAGMTLDVQLGHPIEQRPSTGTGGLTVEGGAAIKP